MSKPKLFSPQIAAKLRDAGLRPTRQRVALAQLLFADGNRHVTAEALHVEALAGGISVSLATIYNTLNQFCESGLLREIAIEGGKAHFDTNISNHQHFYFDREGRLVDIDQPIIISVPSLPEGTEIQSIDVLIRLVERQDAGARSASADAD